ncbi:MAG: NGG1p interacting factor NIF3 [Oleiphilaceae bacterium]|nr:NGG1p interacting factor NIF3 [Oleiphilaceae bacterium]
MYQLCFYVPQEQVDQVKAAVFQAGGGRIGNYDCCCWQTPGLGQFRPLEGSDPFTGKQGRVEVVEEVKVELVCEEALIESVIAALKRSHPYEEPAYHVIRLEKF